MTRLQDFRGWKISVVDGDGRLILSWVALVWTFTGTRTHEHLLLSDSSTTEFFVFQQSFYWTRRFDPETRAFFGYTSKLSKQIHLYLDVYPKKARVSGSKRRVQLNDCWKTKNSVVECKASENVCENISDSSSHFVITNEWSHEGWELRNEWVWSHYEWWIYRWQERRRSWGELLEVSRYAGVKYPALLLISTNRYAGVKYVNSRIVSSLKHTGPFYYWHAEVAFQEVQEQVEERKRERRGLNMDYYG